MKKAQVMTLGDAPSIVLIVGLVFLIMATIAFVASAYGGSFPSNNNVVVNNETIGTIDEISGSNQCVAHSTDCNFANFNALYVTYAVNGTTVLSSNYTQYAPGCFKTTSNSPYNNTNWNISYTSTYSGAACNITSSLNSNLSSNVSIAGIVLTISLVGIVLTVLIGVFVLVGKRRV